MTKNVFFYERHKSLIKYFAEKSFSVLRGVNGLPWSTLKVFFPIQYLIIFSHWS